MFTGLQVSSDGPKVGLFLVTEMYGTVFKKPTESASKSDKIMSLNLPLFKNTAKVVCFVQEVRPEWWHFNC